MGWAVPLVTGKKYRMYFGKIPTDWLTMTVTQSARWQPTDLEIYTIMNFTEARAVINVTVNGVLHANETLNPLVTTNRLTGDNIVYNDSSVKELHVVYNGV